LITLYSLTLFVNAALLFIIEPMIAKMILPYLGGSPAVWNASLVFYQGCLLIGYAYAHYGSSWLGIKRHAFVHLGLVFAAIWFLPVALPVHWFSPPTASPTRLVLSALTVSIGFPFLVIAAGAPLLQKWFAECGLGAARDPYFLYAASNGGSMVGLLAYPIFSERSLTISQQNQFWFYGYLGLSGLIALSMLLYLRLTLRPVAQSMANVLGTNISSNTDPTSQQEIPLPRRLRWLLWSLVPSSLLCGVTTFITTDVAAAPLFWVIPLAAYLLSFIIAFGGAKWTTSAFMARRQAFLLLGAALTVAVGATSPVYVVLPLHLLAFFITAVICHGRLAEDRPPAIYLTNFYLWISIGGVLGGLFNALLAPQIFKTVFEYPLMMVAAAFIRPFVDGDDGSARSKNLDWLLPLVLGIAMIVLIEVGKTVTILPRSTLHLLIFGATGIICLSFGHRPVRFGMGFLALLVIAAMFPPLYGEELFRDRSFFGAYRATYDAGSKRYLLFHGTTIHGVQNAEASSRLQPLSYYHRSGPAGQVLVASAQNGTGGKVAVVGLGTGALACHGSRSQHFTFYEIDPLVESIARDTRLFTYLRDCPPQIDVVIGDARLSLASAPDRQYDIFVFDAFSSDVIPVHLLTREALELYVRKTTSDGVLLFHISNRYMDLAPVLDRLAKELKLAALIQNDVNLSAELFAAGKSPSRWILLARDQRALEPFTREPRWRALDGNLGGDLWTDEYSDVLKVLHWR
jgi:hypothetical protein